MASDPLRRAEQRAVASVESLVEIYELAARRLQLRIRTAIASGRLGEATYLRRQLKAVQRVLDELYVRSGGKMAAAIRRAHDVGVDQAEERIRALGGPNVRLGGAVPTGQVNVLALEAEGNLRSAIRTVGRSATDVFREVGLREAAAGLAEGASVERISSRQVEEYTKRGITGFTDKRGRRWRIDTYARMVARTTTREAATIGAIQRTRRAGLDLVEVSSHSGSCPICIPYDGETFSLSGLSEGYPPLAETPPFHPNCEHVIGPARANFD